MERFRLKPPPRKYALLGQNPEGWRTAMNIQKKESTRFVVTRDTIQAYEKMTGFTGIGRFMEKRGLMVIVEDKPCNRTV